MRVEGTPRRLVAILEGLAPRQRADESRVRGPPASVSSKGVNAIGPENELIEREYARIGLVHGRLEQQMGTGIDIYAVCNLCSLTLTLPSWNK